MTTKAVMASRLKDMEGAQDAMRAASVSALQFLNHLRPLENPVQENQRQAVIKGLRSQLTRQDIQKAILEPETPATDTASMYVSGHVSGAYAAVTDLWVEQEGEEGRADPRLTAAMSHLHRAVTGQWPA